MAVDSLLQKLGLTDYVDIFHAEQIDRDALVCLTFLLFLLCFFVTVFLRFCTLPFYYYYYQYRKLLLRCECFNFICHIAVTWQLFSVLLGM